MISQVDSYKHEGPVATGHTGLARWAQFPEDYCEPHIVGSTIK